jgi:acyl carrier protein
VREKRRINRFIADVLAPDLPTDLGVTGDPLADGMLDSLAIEQLIDFIEDEFGVDLSDDELVGENFTSVDAVVRLIRSSRRG